MIQKYSIQLTELALENLESISKRQATQILNKIARLEHDLHGDIKRLQNADYGYRLRMGDYRVLFDVHGDQILIQRIGNRRDIYE